MACLYLSLNIFFFFLKSPVCFFVFFFTHFCTHLSCLCVVFMFCCRTEILEKPPPAEKKYEPIPQMTPSLPPAKLPKPPVEGQSQTTYL